MIKKKLGKFTAICDVCSAPGPGAETFAGAVNSKRSAGWVSKRYRRDGKWYDVCPECLKEQEALHAQGKKNLLDIL